MQISIDGVGRIVIPKSLRKELGIEGPTELELSVVDGKLELGVPDTPAHVEVRDGLSVIVTDRLLPPLGVEAVRDVIEHGRK